MKAGAAKRFDRCFELLSIPSDSVDRCSERVDSRVTVMVKDITVR